MNTILLAFACFGIFVAISAQDGPVVEMASSSDAADALSMTETSEIGIGTVPEPEPIGIITLVADEVATSESVPSVRIAEVLTDDSTIIVLGSESETPDGAEIEETLLESMPVPAAGTTPMAETVEAIQAEHTTLTTNPNLTVNSPITDMTTPAVTSDTPTFKNTNDAYEETNIIFSLTWLQIIAICCVAAVILVLICGRRC